MIVGRTMLHSMIARDHGAAEFFHANLADHGRISSRSVLPPIKRHSVTRKQSLAHAAQHKYNKDLAELQDHQME
jgi:hypothetical protein